MNLLLIATSLVLIAQDTDYELRTWGDASGRFTVEARFLSQADGIVKLESEDGEELEAPIDQLRPEDQRYLERIASMESSGVNSGTKSVFRSYSALIEARNRQFLAEQVLELYRTFINDPTIDQEARDKAHSQIDQWEARADRNMFRYGTKWVTAAEKQRMQEHGEELIRRAESFLATEDLAKCIETLEKASEVDVGGIEADFSLGMYWALVGMNPKEARDHFLTVCRRLELYDSGEHGIMSRNLAVALSNLALTELRLDEASDAVSHFEQALRLAPDLTAIHHNAIHAYRLGGDNQHFYMPEPTHRKLEILVRAHRSDVNDSLSTLSWLYQPLYESESTQGAAVSSSADASENLNLVGYGSGFVVAPGVVVTNQHVVNGAEGFDLVFDDGTSSRGQTMAVHPELDLALVKFDDLYSDGLPIATEPSRLGTEIGLLGFPDPDVLSGSLKFTRGVVTEADSAHRIMFDALATQGNSGGPILDATGQVVGVCAVQINAALENRYNTGVSSAALLEFIEDEVPNFANSDAKTYDDWPALIDDARSSVVQIRILAKPGSSRLSNETGQQAAYFEDTFCMTCNGHSLVQCTARGCNGGGITVKDPYIVQTNKGPITMYRSKRVACPVCDGEGAVDCPNSNCSRGRDSR